MEKTVEYYMKLPYPVRVVPTIDGGYGAEVEGLPGCWADGDTWAELEESIQASKRLWIESALELGMGISEPEPIHS